MMYQGRVKNLYESQVVQAIRAWCLVKCLLVDSCLHLLLSSYKTVELDFHRVLPELVMYTMLSKYTEPSHPSQKSNPLLAAFYANVAPVKNPNHHHSQSGKQR